MTLRETISIITLCVMLTTSASLLAQIQVSEINYIAPRDDNPRRGFIAVDETQYFIEQGESTTRISTIKDNQVTLLHVLDARPTDSDIILDHYNYDDNPSGLMHDGQILYELYPDYIYEIDIVSGRVERITDLRPHGVSIYEDFHRGPNYFVFDAETPAGRSGIRVDRVTGEVDIIPRINLVIGSKSYYTTQDNSKVLYRDLIRNVDVETSMISNRLLWMTKQYWRGEYCLTRNTGYEFQILDSQDSLHIFSYCTFGADQITIVGDTYIALYTCNIPEHTIVLLDLYTCQEVTRFNVSADDFYGSYNVLTTKGIYNKFFITRPSGEIVNNPSHLFDLESGQKAAIKENGNIELLTQSSVVDNHLHYLTHERATDSDGRRAEWQQLNSVNLETYHVREYLRDSSNLPVLINLGGHALNSAVHVAEFHQDQVTVNQLDVTEDSLTMLQAISHLTDVGISSEIIADIWVDGTYIFSTIEAVYCTKDDDTRKIIDISPDCVGTSAFVTHEGRVYALVPIDSSVYELVISLDNMSHVVHRLDYPKELSHKKLSHGTTIVNLMRNDSEQLSNIYYDVAKAKMTTLPAPKSRQYLSGNIVLQKGHTPLNTQYTWINTNDEIELVFELEHNGSSVPLPDGEGGFFITTRPSYFGKSEVHYIDSTGTLKDLTSSTAPDYKSAVYDSSDRLGALLFTDDDSTYIKSIVDQKTLTTAINLQGGRFTYNTYWKHHDCTGIIELRSESGYDTYYYTPGSEAKLIRNTEARLIAHMESADGLVLVYKEADDHLSFYNFSFIDLSVESIDVLPTDLRSNLTAAVKLDSTTYLLNFSDGIHGLEPWIYDISQHEMYALEDINQGHPSSHMSDYTRDPQSGNIYFTATKTAGNRQLYRLEPSTSVANEVEDIQAVAPNIAPNPSQSTFSISQDCESVSITSLGGQKILTYRDYHEGQRIAVDHLPAGVYIVNIITSDSEHTSTKLIKL